MDFQVGDKVKLTGFHDYARINGEYLKFGDIVEVSEVGKSEIYFLNNKKERQYLHFINIEKVSEKIPDETPQKIIPEKFKVNAINSTISECLQKLAFSIGYEWFSSGEKVQNQHIYLYFVDNKIYQADKKYFISNKDEEEISIGEAINYFLNSKKLIRIGAYKVIFHKNEIKVGCQTIPKKTVKEIYKKLFNK